MVSKYREFTGPPICKAAKSLFLIRTAIAFSSGSGARLNTSGGKGNAESAWRNSNNRWACGSALVDRVFERIRDISTAGPLSRDCDGRRRREMSVEVSYLT